MAAGQPANQIVAPILFVDSNVTFQLKFTNGLPFQEVRPHARSHLDATGHMQAARKALRRNLGRPLSYRTVRAAWCS